MTTAQAAAVKLIDALRKAVWVKKMGGDPVIELSKLQTLLAFLEEAKDGVFIPGSALRDDPDKELVDRVVSAVERHMLTSAAQEKNDG
jgi:hypothetical protein